MICNPSYTDGIRRGVEQGVAMLTPLEKAVLDVMLDRPGEPYATLRQHLAHAVITKREFSGVGFFTSFMIPNDAPVRRDLADTVIQDVAADISGLEHGASFMLFIRNGVLSMLEGVAPTGEWPKDTHDFRVYRPEVDSSPAQAGNTMNNLGLLAWGLCLFLYLFFVTCMVPGGIALLLSWIKGRYGVSILDIPGAALAGNFARLALVVVAILSLKCAGKYFRSILPAFFLDKGPSAKDAPWWLVAQWGARQQPVEACAAWAADLFRRLAAVDRGLRGWYRTIGLESCEESLRHPMEPTTDALRGEFENCRSRVDDQAVRERLVFALRLWNGPRRGGILVDVRQLASPLDGSAFASECLIASIYASLLGGPVWRRVSRPEKLRKIMAAVVATWNPDVAYVSSPAMSEAAWPDREKGHGAPGWLTYVSDRYGPLPALPDGYTVERLEGLGNLILIDGATHCNAAAPAHAAAVRRLSEVLTQAGIPLTPPISPPTTSA
jgi:hypothetical protein